MFHPQVRGKGTYSTVSLKTKQNKLHGLSLRANYTNRAITSLSATLLLIFADRWVSHSQHGGSPTPVISSIVLKRLSGPRFRPTTSLKIWQHHKDTFSPHCSNHGCIVSVNNLESQDEVTIVFTGGSILRPVRTRHCSGWGIYIQMPLVADSISFGFIPRHSMVMTWPMI
jgi:hypothetical protein